MMKLTTLCYIEQNGSYLMLHRTKKEIDPNKDKWIAPGGKFLEGETPEECMLREVKEETGLTLKDYRLRGIVTFLSDQWEGEYMFLYTADQFEGKLETESCDEGELRWVKKEEILSLILWEGDKNFLKYLMEGGEYFSLKLRYQGEHLAEVQETFPKIGNNP